MSFKLDLMLCTSQLHVDEAWGFDQLMKYTNDIALISSGNMSVRELKVVNHNYFLSSDGSQTPITEGSTKADSIAVLQLSGFMQMEDGFCSDGIKSLARQIGEISPDQAKAIIIETNTGGGESLAGQLLSNTVKDAKVPVYFYNHFAASAGVMAQIHAKGRWAAGSQTRIGSLGSYISINKKALEEFKATYEDIYSRNAPEKNGPIRQYMDGKKEALIEAVTQSGDAFTSEVAKYMPLNKDMLASTLAGGVFYAEDAKNRGLIDNIGTLNELINYINNTETMNVQQQIDALKASIASFIGVSADTSTEDLAKALSSTSIAKITEDVHNQLKASFGTLEAELKASIAKLNVTEIDATLAKVAKLTTDLESRASGLEKNLADLEAKNSTGKFPNTGEVVTGAEKELFSSIASIEGESKY